jgi:hypothetical protein
MRIFFFSDAELQKRRPQDLTQTKEKFIMGSNTSSNPENRTRSRSRSRSTIRRVYPETREIRREEEINTESESVNGESQTPEREIRPTVLPLTPPPLPPQVPDRTYNIPGLLPPLIPAPILETLIQPCTHDSPLPRYILRHLSKR